MLLIMIYCRELEGWLSGAKKLPHPARAVICPHAGYRYNTNNAKPSKKKIGMLYLVKKWVNLKSLPFPEILRMHSKIRLSLLSFGLLESLRLIV